MLTASMYMTLAIGPFSLSTRFVKLFEVTAIIRLRVSISNATVSFVRHRKLDVDAVFLRAYSAAVSTSSSALDS